MEINRKDFSLLVFLLFPIFTSNFSCVEGAFSASGDLARAGAEGSDVLRSGPEQSLALANHPDHAAKFGHGSLVPSHPVDGAFPVNNFGTPGDIPNPEATQEKLAQTVQQLSEALEKLQRPGSTPKTPGHNFRVDPTYSDEKPIQQHIDAQKRKKWIEAQKKARLPPLHSEKYDWHVVRWTKALGRGTKKVLGYFFRGLWKVIAFPFKTIIKDPREEAALATEIQKPKKAVESALNKDKDAQSPFHFPFMKEDDMMHRARLVGEQVQKSGVANIQKAMKNNRPVQQDNAISELRELPSYLEAQKNLFQAHEILMSQSNRDKLDSLVHAVRNVYQDNAKMTNSMEQIFEKYVDYFRHLLDQPAPRSMILNRYPWIGHIPIGPIDLPVREPAFLQEVLKSDILGTAEEESRALWAQLEPHAIELRQIYGKPAEDLTRWQNVISQYESKLAGLSEDERNDPSSLIPQFDELAKDEINGR